MKAVTTVNDHRKISLKKLQKRFKMSYIDILTQNNKEKKFYLNFYTLYFVTLLKSVNYLFFFFHTILIKINFFFFL